jgi:hypothetical protein
MSCLVLDAMGVIFKSADDVAELLIPFISEKTRSSDEEAIQSAYIEVSLGKIDPDEFWAQVNMPPESENDYLSRHSLNPGVQLSAGVSIFSLSFLTILYCLFHPCSVARGIPSSSAMWRNDKSVWNSFSRAASFMMLG